MNIQEQIRGLYNKEPDAIEIYNCHYNWNGGFEGNLKKITIQDLTINNLLKLNNDKKSSLSTLLAYLPPEIVFENFGEEVLTWTWINYGIEDKKNEMREKLEKLTGKKSDFLEKARLTAWRFFSRQDYKMIMKTFHTINNLEDSIKNINLKELLQKNAKQGIELSEKRMQDYSLISLRPEKTYRLGHDEKWGLREVQNKKFSIYVDGPAGFCLVYKNNPQALVSFVPKSLQKLMILQLQGVKGMHKIKKTDIHARGLMPLNWKSLLVDLVKQYAQEQKFTQLIIQGGHNNRWTKKGWVSGSYQDKIHIPLEKALIIYDEFAKSIGFNQKKDKDWYQKIE